MDITIWKSTKCPLKLLLRNILWQSFELNLCCSRKSPTMITAVFILSLLIFFCHNSFFLNISVNSPISSLHAPLIINKSAFVRDFGKEANQKYLKMWSIDPWWVLIILDMRALMLLFCFVFQKFNDYLDGLSEHYDIPKVSWTKWSSHHFYYINQSLTGEKANKLFLFTVDFARKNILYIRFIIKVIYH